MRAFINWPIWQLIIREKLFSCIYIINNTISPLTMYTHVCEQVYLIISQILKHCKKCHEKKY